MSRRLSVLILGGLMLVPIGAAHAQGLKGEYFSGRTFTGTPLLTRIEAVNFNWGGNAPDPALTADNFCVRWTGSITIPVSGSYVFTTRSDDGVRLMLAGDWVIDNWSDHSAALNNSVPIDLEAGKSYGVRLEFYENGGDAVIEFSWTPPGGIQEFVPASVLSTTYVRPVQARKPSPAKGALDVSVSAFSWMAGENALQHNFYLSTSPNLTEADRKVSRLAKAQYYVADLTPGQTYYWRVDEIEKDGKTLHEGDVWWFMMQDVMAYRPLPADGSNEASPAPVLTWLPGMDIAMHHLYFSSNRDAVVQGAAEADKGTFEFTQESFTPGALDSLTTYYWRVDETLLADESVLPGPVWSFTTCTLVDDFESYTDDVGSRVFQTWIDGWGYTEPAPGNLGNGTGSTIGYDPTVRGIMETSIVHSGLQSVPMDYNNVNQPWYSEAQREYSPAENWTVSDVNTLVLYVRGTGANAQAPLYVAIEDASRRVAVVVHSDPAVVKSYKWVQWKIPLSQFTGVSMSAVKKLYIGVGDRKAPKAGGAGRLYLDDICVTKPAPAGQ